MNCRILSCLFIHLIVAGCGKSESIAESEVRQSSGSEIERRLSQYSSEKVLGRTDVSEIVTFLTDVDIYASIPDAAGYWAQEAMVHGVGHSFSCLPYGEMPSFGGSSPWPRGDVYVNAITKNAKSTEIELRVENCRISSNVSISSNNVLVNGILRLSVTLDEVPELANGNSCVFYRVNSAYGQYVKDIKASFDDLSVSHQYLSATYPDPAIGGGLILFEDIIVKESRISGYIEKTVGITIDVSPGIYCPDKIDYLHSSYSLESYSEGMGNYSYFMLVSHQNYSTSGTAEVPVISGKLASDSLGAVSINSASPPSDFPLLRPNYLLSFSNDNNTVIYAHGLRTSFQNLKRNVSSVTSFYSEDKETQQIIDGLNLFFSGSLPLHDNDVEAVRQPWTTIESLNNPPSISIYGNRVFALIDGNYRVDVSVFDEETEIEKLVVTVEWFVNDVLVPGESESTLSGEHVGSGDILSAIVSVNDGSLTRATEVLFLYDN